MPTTDDPITEYLEQRRQAREELDAALMLDQAVNDEQAEQETPPIESLTAGGQPSDYTPPTINDDVRLWMRERICRIGGEPPPAA